MDSAPFNWKDSLPLMLVLFIDGMGISIVFPILNTLLINPHSSFLSAGYNHDQRNALYGIILSVFLFAAFFASTVLGDLSDQIGRKKTLLICLMGSAVSFILTAFAMIMHSLAWLIVGRVIDGFTTGSQPIAQAAIIEINTTKRIISIGYIYCALSLGLVLGPMMAGVLMNSHWVSWFSITFVMYFTSAISIINAVLLAALFKEPRVRRHYQRIDLIRPIKLVIDAFRHRALTALSVVFIFCQLGWSFFYSYITVDMLQTFHLTAVDTMGLMAVIGVGFVIGSVFLPKWLERWLPMRASLLCMYTAFTLLVIPLFTLKNALLDWLLIVPIVATSISAYITVTSLYSHLVNPERQGWVMGVSVSLSCLGLASAALAGGWLLNIGEDVPIMLACGLTAVGVVLGCALYNHLTGAPEKHG